MSQKKIINPFNDNKIKYYSNVYRSQGFRGKDWARSALRAGFRPNRNNQVAIRICIKRK